MLRASYRIVGAVNVGFNAVFPFRKRVMLLY
jgi:hypothetical protein